MIVKIAMFGWTEHDEWTWFPVVEGSVQADDADYFRATDWQEVDFNERGTETISDRVQNLDKKRAEEIEDHIRKMTNLAESKARLLSLSYMPQENRIAPEQPPVQSRSFEDDIPF